MRPVAASDAALIVALRNASGQFLNKGAASEALQRAWIETYLSRADDYYFVIERMNDGEPHGLAGIYDVNRVTRRAEWGRFVVRPGSQAAIEAALLIYRCGFETLQLAQIHCYTLVENAKVVAFHDSCGLERGDVPVTVTHNGNASPAIEHQLTLEAWPAVHARLDRLASRLAGSVRGSAAPVRKLVS